MMHGHPRVREPHALAAHTLYSILDTLIPSDQPILSSSVPPLVTVPTCQHVPSYDASRRKLKSDDRHRPLADLRGFDAQDPAFLVVRPPRV